MKLKEISAIELYNLLLEEGIFKYKGNITFRLGKTETIIKAKDTIGNSLQEWLGQWLNNKGIFFFVPPNTQEFPDFYLSEKNAQENMLELKTFNSEATPAFDIANFDSYCESLRTRIFRLDADYLILAYHLDEDTGTITIRNMWLKKVWQTTRNIKKISFKYANKKRNYI